MCERDEKEIEKMVRKKGIREREMVRETEKGRERKRAKDSL